MSDFGALKHPAGRAYDHPAYDDALQTAARRAYEARTETTNPEGYYPPCFGVYYDGEAVYVRDRRAVPPPNAELVCIAQHWSGPEVQLRFNGAYSEWRRF